MSTKLPHFNGKPSLFRFHKPPCRTQHPWYQVCPLDVGNDLLILMRNHWMKQSPCWAIEVLFENLKWWILSVYFLGDYWDYWDSKIIRTRWIHRSEMEILTCDQRKPSLLISRGEDLIWGMQAICQNALSKRGRNCRAPDKSNCDAKGRKMHTAHICHK